jgi:hypothetical protein
MLTLGFEGSHSVLPNSPTEQDRQISTKSKTPATDVSKALFKPGVEFARM